MALQNLITDAFIPKQKEPEEAAPRNDISDLRNLSDEEFIENCRPALLELEVLRLDKKAAYDFRKMIGLPIVIIMTPIIGYIDYWLLFLSRGDSEGAGLSLMFLAAAYWVITAPKRAYAKSFKETIMPRIAEMLGGLVYMIDGEIGMHKMQPSKIIPSYDRVRTEDYFTGLYKGVQVEFSEMHLTERRGSGKNRRTVTTFKGLAILLSMENKKFFGHTIVDHDKSKVSEWLSEKSLGLKRARMGSPKFEELYDAYTNDQVEARYLLDPKIIERFTHLYEYYTDPRQRDERPHEQGWMTKLAAASKFARYGFKMNKKSLRAAYYDNRLLILIESPHNHFEPADLLVPATDPVSILHMKKEVGDILSLVDALEVYDPYKVHNEQQTG